jgi:hypothetical protein
MVIATEGWMCKVPFLTPTAKATTALPVAGGVPGHVWLPGVKALHVQASELEVTEEESQPAPQDNLDVSEEPV